MKKVALILTTLFFLASVCTVALADAVPGALLYLDASDNSDHPKGWKNLGEAGGSLLPADQAPNLKREISESLRLGLTSRT